MSSSDFDKREKWIQEVIRVRFPSSKGFSVQPIKIDGLTVAVRISRGKVLYARYLPYPDYHSVVA